MKIISVIGYKKTGKTTLVEQIVSTLKKNGSVGTIKHLQEHTMNTPDTDTWKHAKAGADVVVGITPHELVKFTKNNDLAHGLDELANAGMDFAVVEGFKDSKLPKFALGDVEVPCIVKRLESLESVDIGELLEIIFKQPEYHTLDSLLCKLKSSNKIEKAGAIGTFTGIVRAVTENTRTEFLEFESHGELAQKKIAEICEDLKQKDGIVDVLMHHRTGIIASGDDIVYIAVAAGHREELFPVLREAIERLKVEVPIWKKEHTVEGEWWVHDTDKK
jgi:molybdopterin synthase catalytic subunit